MQRWNKIILGQYNDDGRDNVLFNNIEKPCEPCGSPSDICGDNCDVKKIAQINQRQVRINGFKREIEKRNRQIE